MTFSISRSVAIRNLGRIHSVLLARFMHRREVWYSQRDDNRIVRPFEWGTSFIADHVNGDDPRKVFSEHAARVLQSSEDFFALPPIGDYALEGDQLTWTSSINTPSVENNTARARLFPARRERKRKPRAA